MNITELIPFFTESVIVVFVFMNLFFIISLILKRIDVVDSAWGLGFIVLSLFHLVRSGLFLQTKLIITFLVFLWALRLVSYITLRNWGKSEDFRYENWREKWGGNVIVKSYLQVFLLQGILMIFVALPITLYNRFGGIVINAGFVGLIIWLAGYYFETVSDLQMYYFKRNHNNEGKIINWGLWKYSRHPNYFGEVLQWWGLWILTLGSNYWYIGAIGPLLITFLILKVSGIPMLEKKYENNPDFKNYKKHTSEFIPWFPKKPSSP